MGVREKRLERLVRIGMDESEALRTEGLAGGERGAGIEDDFLHTGAGRMEAPRETDELGLKDLGRERPERV